VGSQSKLSSVYGYIIVAASFLILLIAFESITASEPLMIFYMIWMDLRRYWPIFISVFVGGVLGWITGSLTDSSQNHHMSSVNFWR
jgi:hypothetical protein